MATHCSFGAGLSPLRELGPDGQVRSLYNDQVLLAGGTARFDSSGTHTRS